MAESFSRKQLSIQGRLREAGRRFAELPDTPGGDIRLVDHLLSGLAVVGLKYPSLLQFAKDRQAPTKRANLKTLYGIARAPGDARLRERLDAVDPRQLRPRYPALFSALQRGKGLEGFRYLNGVPLNDANFDLEVNFFEDWKTTPKGKATHFSWVTTSGSTKPTACP